MSILHMACSPKVGTWLCKYALANDLWLGRPDPLLWKANVTHELCLALAKTVAPKVVLRAGGASQTETSNRSSNSWDYVFQQSGLVGSAVVFHNGDAEYALQSLPPRKLDNNVDDQNLCQLWHSMDRLIGGPGHDQPWLFLFAWTCQVQKRRNRAERR